MENIKLTQLKAQTEKLKADLARVEQEYSERKAAHDLRRNQNPNNREALALAGLERQLKEAQKAVVSNQKAITDLEAYLSNGRYKADLERMEAIQKETSRLLVDIEKDARALLVKCGKLFQLVGEHDDLARRGGVPIQLPNPKHYRWVALLEGWIAQWFDDKRWIEFDLGKVTPNVGKKPREERDVISERYHAPK